jgi:hypothetical protein
MIKTESKQYYWGESNYIYSFYIPAFSEVKKIYLVDGYIYMIIDYPSEYNFDSSKLINLKVQSYTTPIEEAIYKYFDTQIATKTELINNSYGNGGIQFSALNTTTPYHFFIQEIKPVIEERDNKIDNIITND